MARNIFYIGSVASMIGWLVGFFLLKADMRIHLLAILSVIFCLQGMITQPGPKTQE